MQTSKDNTWARIVMVEHQYVIFDAIEKACKNTGLVLHHDYVVFGDEIRFSSNTNMLKALSQIKDKTFNTYFTIRYENLEVDIT